MPVPDTNTFSLQDVVNEINPTTNDLVDCIADAEHVQFDPAYYTYPATNLLEFRNYGNQWVIADMDIVAADTLVVTSDINGASQAVGTGVFVDNGGTRVYLIDYAAKTIEQFSLSIAHNLSSTWTPVGTSSALTDAFTMLSLSSDGTKAYVTFSNSGGPTHSIRQHNLSSAWDITTMSTTVANSVSYPTNTFTRGMAFNRDGTKMFGLYDNSGTTYFVHWTLSTGWDLSSAGSATTVDVDTEIGSPSGMFYLEESGNEHVVCEGADTINFKNGLTITDIGSNSGTSYQFPDCQNNDWIYDLKRSGSGPFSYVWTLQQFATNV